MSINSLQLIDEWTFDVFSLSDAAAGAPLRYLGVDLLNRYGVIHKFKVSRRVYVTPPLYATRSSSLIRIDSLYLQH